MRRRDFIRGGVIGAAAAGLAGCSAGKKVIPLKSDMAGFSLEVKRAKPSPGTIATGEIGRTGIKVTRFGYGSHMPKELVKFERERETMLREAFDLGITFFDIYDKSWDIFQMEPMSRHLAPIKNDVVLSVFMEPWDGRTPEQEMARTLRLFRRDYIDMVRYYTLDAQSPIFNYWDKLFQMKEKGLIRAVGMPIHYPKEVDHVLERFPLDYVILPFNFYHNLLYNGKLAGDMHPFVRNLRKRGVGIVTMKPFGTDWFVNPLIAAAKEIDPDVSLPQAALRYIINSDLKPDATLGGMFSLNQVYENVEAFYQPKLSGREKHVLGKLRKVARVSETTWLPRHYRFLAQWAPDTHREA